MADDLTGLSDQELAKELGDVSIHDSADSCWHGRVLDEAARRLSARGWQPMESAPTGGGAKRTTDPEWVDPPRILAFSPTRGTFVTSWDWFYAEGGQGYEASRVAWVDEDGDSIPIEYTPTHWMPLPSPPEDTSDA